MSPASSGCWKWKSISAPAPRRKVLKDTKDVQTFLEVFHWCTRPRQITATETKVLLHLQLRYRKSVKNKKDYYCNLQDSINNNDNSNNKVGTADSMSSCNSSSSSSSSISSENACLPRIIKPRKRRKKDRKPHVFNSSFAQSPQLSSQTRIMPYFLQTPIYSMYHHNNASPLNPQYLFEDREEAPNLQHSFDDLEDFDSNGNQSESASSTACCQCRYCEPEGIWDFENVNNSSNFKVTEDYFKSEEVDKHFSRRLESSISVDSSSSLVDSLSSLSLDEGLLSPSSSPRVSRDLEVSTEIVTSMNGQHRVLEIKFFSTIVQQDN